MQKLSQKDFQVLLGLHPQGNSCYTTRHQEEGQHHHNSVGSNNDEDIDVEQLEDNEDKHNKSRSSPVSPKAAVMPKKRKDEKPRIRNKCNNDELKYIECILETKDLWDKFHDYETEMIITKTGR